MSCRNSLAAFVLAVLIVHSAAAGPFTSLFVFGDSLSDVGNIDQLTPIPLFSVPDTPGPDYYMGRFSNGPVYVDALAAGLGLPSITHSLAGGNDFAYGGAQTSGTGGLEGIVINDVDEQVASFFDRLAGDPIDPDALFVVWAGANDFIDVAGEIDATVPAGNLAGELEQLAAAGARQFLVPNLPLLGYTPRYNTNSTNFDLYNARSTAFNAALATELDDLEAANPALSIYRLDVAGLIGQAIADPAAFGLTNVTDPAAVGLEPGGSAASIVGNPHEYLFWDTVHPTTTAHAILAEHALALVMPPSLPGDYNGDGKVGPGDYTVWRNLLGETGTGLPADGTGDDLLGIPDGDVDNFDYEFWKLHYGEMAGSGAPVVESLRDSESAVFAAANLLSKKLPYVPNVPEPASLLLLLCGIAALLCLRRSV